MELGTPWEESMEVEESVTRIEEVLREIWRQ
jgi:hypothetical protein